MINLNTSFKLLTLGLAFLTYSCVSNKQEGLITEQPDIKAIESSQIQIIDTLANAWDFNGVIMLQQGLNKPMISSIYGYAQLEERMPPTVSTPYFIGSLTKQFTGAAILKLAEQKSLELDSTVNKYLHDWPKAWEEVTIHDLLKHASGIPDIPELAYTQDMDYTDILKIVANTPLENRGTMSYNNFGYIVLGKIIETVSKESISDFYHKYLFTPAGMTESSINCSRNTSYSSVQQAVPNLAIGYTRDASGYLVRSEPSSLVTACAAGALMASPRDLIKWNNALYGGKIFHDITPLLTINDYNYGLRSTTAGEKKVQVLQHGGAIGGYRSYLGYIPETQTTIVFMSNEDLAQSVEMYEKLLQIALGETIQAPKIDVDQIKKLTGTYVIQDAPEYSFEVRIHKQLLIVTDPDKNVLLFFPISDKTFISDRYKLQVELSTSNQPQLVLTQKGEEARTVFIKNSNM